LNNYPFDTVGLDSDTIDRFTDTYKLLSEKFQIQTTGTIDFHLEDFEVFKGYNGVEVRDSFVIKHPRSDSYILFVDTCYKTYVNSRGIPGPDMYNYQIWALAYLKRDFGRALIRRETLTDKIIELVHPVELDFEEDKAFSDTFYVIVNDRNKAAASMDRNFRNAAMDIRADDFVIEIVGHTLIIGSNQTIFPERSVHLAEFVHRVSSMC
jgi:hypothetical protein